MRGRVLEVKVGAWDWPGVYTVEFDNGDIVPDMKRKDLKHPTGHGN